MHSRALPQAVHAWLSLRKSQQCSLCDTMLSKPCTFAWLRPCHTGCGVCQSLGRRRYVVTPGLQGLPEASRVSFARLRSCAAVRVHQVADRRADAGVVALRGLRARHGRRGARHGGRGMVLHHLPSLKAHAACAGTRTGSRQGAISLATALTPEACAAQKWCAGAGARLPARAPCSPALRVKPMQPVTAHMRSCSCTINTWSTAAARHEAAVLCCSALLLDVAAACNRGSTSG